MTSGGEATIFNEELWWGVGRKASLGPEISTEMHSFDQADDEGGEKSERCRAGLPPRGPLSGLASWEFASLPLLHIHHSTQSSVRSAKLGLQAKGKTEREMQERHIAVA